MSCVEKNALNEEKVEGKDGNAEAGDKVNEEETKVEDSEDDDKPIGKRIIKKEHPKMVEAKEVDSERNLKKEEDQVEDSEDDDMPIGRKIVKKEPPKEKVKKVESKNEDSKEDEKPIAKRNVKKDDKGLKGKVKKVESGSDEDDKPIAKRNLKKDDKGKIKKVEPIAKKSTMKDEKEVIQKIKKVVEKKKAVTVEVTTKKRERKVFDLPGQKREPPEERDPLRIFYESLYEQIPDSDMAAFCGNVAYGIQEPWQLPIRSVPSPYFMMIRSEIFLFLIETEHNEDKSTDAAIDEFRMMESGLLPMNVAKKVYDKKQKKNQQKFNSPIKAVTSVKRTTTQSVIVKKTTSSASSDKKKPESKTVSKQSKKQKVEDSQSEDDDAFVPSAKKNSESKTVSKQSKKRKAADSESDDDDDFVPSAKKKMKK
ncbi:hypothetical protein IFM89_005731 [Coptis chinensis]|uniref:Uncharacterized protein n=1 Tax=Coptis chinensis TaxID=261450 RepID=A0A835M7E5_9MAGN|nr:hypothetical protein IFM89_005731 [Coptis chinensis]